jgi:hypothetical protein
MTETLPEPTPPQTFVDPDVARRAAERKNLIFGWLLVALFVVLFAGTFGVAFVYLWLD